MSAIKYLQSWLQVGCPSPHKSHIML